MPEILINGAEGRLEGRYNPGKGNGAPIALMLHPHPLYGGTMNNKVVYSLHQLFVQRGFSTLRFNFRGVGRSQGTYDGGEGELSDAASALDWLQTYNPKASQVIVAGFSFGAWIGMQLLMRRPEIGAFVSVSPIANMADFTFLAPCPASGLIVQGDRDDVVPKESVDKLVRTLGQQKDITVDYAEVPGANHYYTGLHDQLQGIVGGYVDRNVLGSDDVAVSA